MTDREPASMSEALRLADALHREWKDDALNYDTALDAAAELRRLHAENEALRADAERLNHIEKHARCDPKMDGNHVWWPTSFKHVLKGPTLRAAIDATRKEST